MKAIPTQRNPLVHRLHQYFLLTKPRVVSLIVFCAVIGTFLAVPGAVPPTVLVATTIGVALVGTVMLSTLATGLSDGISNSTVIPVEDKVPLMAAAEEGVQLMSNSQFEQGLEEAGADPVMSDELSDIYAVSRTSAFKAGVALLIYAALVGLVVTLGLPKRKLVDAHEPEASTA